MQPTLNKQINKLETSDMYIVEKKKKSDISLKAI